MPEVDGFAVLNYLQEHRKALPVILLTGMEPNEIQKEMSGLQTHELPPLLLKPVDVGQLLEIVDLQLSGQLPHDDGHRAA
jgi:response regulator RpfG family c-di-GMP phosphodiesterase